MSARVGEASGGACTLRRSDKDEPGISILTTHIKDYCPFWREQTRLLPGWRSEFARAGRTGRIGSALHDFLWGWRLFVNSRDYHAVVTGWERAALVLAALQALFRRKKVPHVLIYTLWQLPKSPLARMLRYAEYRLIASGVTRIVVYSLRQRDLYARYFPFAASKLECVPYYTTHWDTDFTTSRGDYVFAGGDYTRDYRCLIDAVRDLGYRTVIAAVFRHYFEGLHIPDHVTIVTVKHREFIDLMAGARIVVVPLRDGLLQSGGQQTYLNAMAMGKPVVVADDCGADEYIQNGTSGIVIAPGDAAALRDALQTLWNDDTLAASLGANAKSAATAFSPDRFFLRVIEIVHETVRHSLTQ